ncbi:MAG: hypothetical protein ACQGVC_05540 [Myxococcota bacterium]
MRSTTRSTIGALALGIAVGLLGCATIEHSMSVSDVAGRTLPVRGAEGAERLRSEIEVDETIRDYVARHGKPDYLHVVDHMSLYFFYVKEDMAVKFERDLIPPSTARRLGRIPGSLMGMLPRRDAEALVARRKAARRTVRRTTPRPAVRKAAPAAQAPTGLSLSTFNVRKVVARLSPPRTAADAGIGGWRSVKFSDGVSGQIASAGGTRYEIRRDRLVLALRLRGGRAPGEARLEVLRLNSATFGAHAESITRQMLPALARVAADGSGRTRVAERVRGRLVRIDRLGARGEVVYTILP